MRLKWLHILLCTAERFLETMVITFCICCVGSSNQNVLSNWRNKMIVMSSGWEWSLLIAINVNICNYHNVGKLKKYPLTSPSSKINKNLEEGIVFCPKISAEMHLMHVTLLLQQLNWESKLMHTFFIKLWMLFQHQDKILISMLNISHIGDQVAKNKWCNCWWAGKQEGAW